MHQQNTSALRPLVRGSYDLQKLRIQMGNRLAAQIRGKMGIVNAKPGVEKTPDEEEKQNINMLNEIMKSYKRLTDGLVEKGRALPTVKKFVGDAIISDYAELVLVEQYVQLVANEEDSFKRLGKVLEGIPIYDEFLSVVDGIGPQMAAIIISEIDINNTIYPSGLHKYAGLDTVTVGHYIDDKGKEVTVTGREIWAHYENIGENEDMYINGHKVTFSCVGRSKQDVCLVERDYTAKDGTTKTKLSITFNPFLKTKLVGVLGPSFLKVSKVFVDNERMSTANRLELAKSKGFDPKTVDKHQLNAKVVEFLRMVGMDIREELSPYAKIYYDYRNRLYLNPVHNDKTDRHKHNMAIRYMVKMFLNDLYAIWRELHNLPVSETYEVAKLGLVHGQPKPGYVYNRNSGVKLRPTASEMVQ